MSVGHAVAVEQVAQLSSPAAGRLVPPSPLALGVPSRADGAAADLPALRPDTNGGETMCSVCSSSSHLRRNCPQVQCASCGAVGHFRADCPQTAPAGRAGAADRDDAREDPRDGLQSAVCRACGSPRHVQARCPMRTQTLECYQCHQVGHIMTMCPQTRCYNCGTYGHSSQVCHSQPHCFHCSHAGHRSSECPIKYKGRVCYQCHQPGHEAANCPQGQLCRLCRQPGHLVAHCPEVQCNNCHERGHSAGVCAKQHCWSCGSVHEAGRCSAQAWQFSYSSFQDGFSETAPPLALPPPPDTPDDSTVGTAASDLPAVTAGAGASVLGAPAPVAPPVDGVPAYTPTGEPRSGRVAVVVDGPYFERCVRSSGKDPHHTADYYTRAAEALRHALQYVGDILHCEPIAFWYDTDPAAFTEFLETAMPLAHREDAFRETAMRKKYLTDEMNGDRTLHNVVARLVGGMKRQYGYTPDGPGYVWVQTGVDVALSTSVIDHFYDAAQYQQVVLLCGDSDVYPAVHYCNALRQRSPQAAQHGPVRVCGTSTSLSKVYGQHQDLSDFLPRILLDRPSHTERGRTLQFPTSAAFV